MNRWIPTAILALATLPAAARVIPGSCGFDSHIQCAVYDPNEVYEVATAPGKAILLHLEPGETIEDAGAGMGDGKAWNVSANKNWILLKRAAQRPDTNLVVVTNRRAYTFDLVTATRGVPEAWVLKFDYPDTRARLSAEDARKRTQAMAIARVSASAAKPRNDAYAMRGHLELAPTSAWDDGTFTHLRYATARDLPRIYVKRADGSEFLPPYHMEGDTIVVHEIAREFVARLGSAVLGIRNDGYSPEGLYNAAGTTVPGMVRLTKEHK
ncbi:TrbG/VirB9 family P-type conjugative transfer protein [Ralstonia pseudosolanacearum]|uniref:TrbG/VirB9 family P-type conjugative transfer protein n=1 Tax=Ralstonia pseudosolanacearum TaxID=1310165 RepID=UPI002004259B|nr:TrbG/VirB9 family P-type conjugative transfer protein [Ralstonia pseudosolanacearum]MCK4140084.1 TrbG/VirB9 family P-type conjugative transfer protein [Ralstonia pseudosolanacearum]